MTMISDTSGSTGDRGFLRGLQVQGSVIGALLMRELHTRYGRENIGYLWIFIEPMTLAGAVSLIHVGSAAHGETINPVAFFLLGYTVFLMFRGMISRAESTLEANMPLLYHRRVTIFDMMFARALLEGASTIVTYVVLMGLIITMGVTTFPDRPLELVIGMFFMFWFSFALSMIICGWTHDNRLVARLIHPLTYILMPLSGAFYQLIWIPEPYRTWMSYFPLTVIYELIRYGQFHAAEDTYVDIPYITAWCLLLTYGGLVFIRATRRRVHLH